MALMRLEKRTNKRDMTFLICSCVLISFASYAGNDRLYTILTLGSLVLGVFLNPILPLCITISTNPIGLATSAVLSIIKYVLVTVPVLFTYFKKKSLKINISDFWILFGGSCIIILSLLFGQDAKFTTAIIQVIILIAYFITCNCDIEDNKLLITSFVLAGSCIALIVIFQLITNSAVWLWEYRLTYEGSVRTLSSAIAFPIFVLLYNILTDNFGFKKSFGRILSYVFSAILILLLIATYSRGVLLALIFSCVYILLSQLRKISLRKMITYIVLFICVSFFVMNADLSTDMLFNNIDTAGGRTDIWKYFFEKLLDRGLAGVLFGFGPGDMLRIAEGTAMAGYYSHSAFLDYIFSYGLFGGILVLAMVLRAFRKASKNRNVFALGLFVLTVFMYATYNNSASLELHIYLALAFSISENEVFTCPNQE